MKKKIFVIIFGILIFFSCGKKGDPVYKESQNSEIIVLQKIKFS